MYEPRNARILPFRLFLVRVAKSAMTAVGFITVSLSIGILGYHVLEKMDWIDSLLNASMILGGMGPVGELRTVAGKLFASFYALFSGVVFLVVAGILFAPVVHRFLHRFHADQGREHVPAAHRGAGPRRPAGGKGAETGKVAGKRDR
jgi:hypothetical protein